MVYDAYGFLEKNRDSLSTNVVDTLAKVANPVICELFSTPLTRVGSFHESQKTRAEKSQNQHKLSVSANFKNSLLDLMDKMMAARPYFVRCIKPNKQKQASYFNETDVITQLKYTGVVETTRIRRDGYALRFTFQEFIEKYQTLGLRAAEVPDFTNEDDPPSEENVIHACRKIIKAANLRGAQVGKTIVFLKYYHGETLLRLMASQHASATVLNNAVRRWLAIRTLVALKEAKARAEAEARAKAEREAAERALAEKLRREKEEAERAAAEAAARAERLREEQRMASIRAKKKREEEERLLREAQEEAMRRAEAARLAEEKLKREAEEAARREAEEKARREAEEAAQREAEEREREERRRKEQEAFRAEQEAAKRRNSIVSILPEDELGGGAAAANDDPESMLQSMAAELGLDDAFSELLNDGEVDEEERQLLAQKRAERQREEVARKKRLQKEYEQQQRDEERRRIAELNAIAERERVAREEREHQAALDAEDTAKRLAELDFGGFAFGASGGGFFGAAATTSAGAPPLPPPPKSPAPTMAPSVEKLNPPATPAPAHMAAISPMSNVPPMSPSQPASSDRFSLKKKKARPPPPPPPPGKAASPPAKRKEDKAASVKQKKESKLESPSLKRKNKSRSPSPAARPTPPPPPPAIQEPAAAAAAAPAPAAPKDKAPAPAAKPKPPPVSPKPKRASVADRVPSEPPAGPPPALPPPIVPPPAGPPPAAAPAPAGPPPAAAPAPAEPAAAAAPPLPPPPKAEATAAAGGEEKPRRRKLVRGANAIQTPVLPEFTAAMEALDSVIAFLDQEEALMEQQEAARTPTPTPEPAAVSEMADTVSPLKVVGSPLLGSVQRRPSMSKLPRPATEQEVMALNDLLLIGEKEQSQFSEAPLTDSVRTRWLSAVRYSENTLKLNHDPTSGSPKRRPSTSALDRDGNRITPKDLLHMPEEQRLDILNRVKRGEITIEDALAEVVETKVTQNCVIS